ncbi:MAG: SurA N-terminal domain-containing protein, partial [Pseudomonadota bacterium]
MLQDIRERFIGTTGKVVLAVILLLLAGTGLNYTISPAAYIARVNGKDISPQRFDSTVRTQLARLGDQTITPELQQQVQRLALEQTIQREILIQHIEAQGFRVSDQQVSDFIRQIPDFQVDGVFDADTYRRLIAQALGQAPAQFENDVRRDLLVTQYTGGLLESSFMSPGEARRLIELFREEREVEYATLSADELLPEVVVDEAAVDAYYNDNPTRFQTPQQAAIDYVLVDTALAQTRVDSSDAALAAFFETIKDDYAAQEERRASHILIRNEDAPAAATELITGLAARLAAGEVFEDLAREYSNDGASASRGGDLGWIRVGDLVGPVESALFGLPEPGAISEIVQSEFGLHIIRLDEVRDGDAPTLLSVRDEVEQRYRESQSAEILLSLQRELADQLFAAQSLEEIAEAMSLEVRTVAAFTETSPVPFGINAAMTDALFGDQAIAEGQLRDVQLDAERSAVVRVTARTPAGRQPLEAVAKEIRETLEREAAVALASERGMALLAQLEAAPEAAFAELFAESGMALAERRYVPRQDPTVPAAVASAIF